MNPNHSKTKKEKELADNARLLRAWKKFHCDELAEALAGLHRDVMTRLTSHLKQLRSARELVEFIEAKDWSAVDTRTRLVSLHEINSAICELREKQGLPPIDDALPGEPLRAYQVIVAVNVDRYVIYWNPDGTGPDRRKSFYLKPGQKFPDIDQMNADTPKDQWRESFGKDVGPWQAQYIVRLLHPVSMKRYSFPTSTDGGHIAVRELRQRTKDMRQVRGEHVYALVQLRDTFMPTAYGGRQPAVLRYRAVRHVRRRWGGQKQRACVIGRALTGGAEHPVDR